MTAPSPAAAGLPLEDVERVARAIAASAMGLDEMDEDGWEYYLDAHEQEEHLRMAAAALAEMRPTAAEVEARVQAAANRRAAEELRAAAQWLREASLSDVPGPPAVWRHLDTRAAALAPVPPDANGGEER